MKLMVGNWKMNLKPSEGLQFAQDLKASLTSASSVEIVVCPPFVDIPQVAWALGGSPVKVGAQNMHHEEKGAYTGEISPLMLKEVAEFVLVGHSERRHIFGEKDADIAKKVAAALHHDLIPILCVGETLVDRRSGHAERVVSSQLEAGLSEVSAGEIPKVVVAYEPVWAIGTGMAIKPADGEEMAGFIRKMIDATYGEKASRELKILYGGSVSSENVESFISLPDIDGALVGGASVYVDEWMKILKIAGAKVKK